MRNRPAKEESVSRRETKGSYADPYESLLASVNKIRISSPPHSKSVTRKRRQNPSDITDRLFDFAKNIEHHTKYNPLKSGYVSYQSARTQSKRHKTSNSPVPMSVPMSVPMQAPMSVPMPMSRSNSLRDDLHFVPASFSKPADRRSAGLDPYHGIPLYTKRVKNSSIEVVPTLGLLRKRIVSHAKRRSAKRI